jgi:hypothetical protein
MLYSFFRGITNIIHWVPVIWRDEDYDWAFMSKIMEFKLHRMSKYFKDNGHTINCPTSAKQTLVCAALLRRLRENNYLETSRQVFPERFALRASLSRAADDQKYLGFLIGKYFRHWWD